MDEVNERDLERVAGGGQPVDETNWKLVLNWLNQECVPCAKRPCLLKERQFEAAKEMAREGLQFHCPHRG